MVEWARDKWSVALWWLANILLESVIAKAVAILIPIVGIGALLKFGRTFVSKHGDTLLLVEAVLLTGSYFAAFLWYRSNSSKRTERISNVARAMLLHQAKVIAWRKPPGNVSEAHRVSELKAAVDQLLNQVREALAYQMRVHRKGASFLVLMSDDPDSRFAVFHKCGHHDNEMYEQVYRKLRRDNCYAGQAIDGDRVEGMRDCNHPPRKVPYVKLTNGNERFKGRYAVRVKAQISPNTFHDLGALCFDTASAHSLNREDRMLLQLYADLIGEACGTWIQTYFPTNGVEIIRRNCHIPQ